MLNILFKIDMVNYLIIILYVKLVKYLNFDRFIEMNYFNKVVELYDKVCSILEVNLSFMFYFMFLCVMKK